MNETRFGFTLQQIKDFQFLMEWDVEGMADLMTDEPPPLGELAGPNPTRLLAAAVANCLSASLLFALRKFRDQPATLHAQVEGELARNEDNRWRVAGIKVDIQLSDAAEALPHLERALAQFESFCVVTESVRQGIPVNVRVLDANGLVVKEAGG